METLLKLLCKDCIMTIDMKLSDKYSFNPIINTWVFVTLSFCYKST